MVDLQAEVSFLAVSGGKLDIAERGCTLSSGEAVTCLPVKTCLTYTGIGVQQKIGKIK